MKFQYTYQKEEPQAIKYYVQELGLSRGLLARIKFQGGKITVNDKEENVLYLLQKGDVLELTFPREESCDHLTLDPTPLDICFEDEHFLIIHKPAGVPSIPVRRYPEGTMVNRVKNYYFTQGYENQQVHVITRLDKNTSGLMLLAKHSFAHAKMDVCLREKTLKKQYIAFVEDQNQVLKEHDWIKASIRRKTNSTVERETCTEGGQAALTEYKRWFVHPNVSGVKVQLHTGRTHQIRVHFSSIGCPLLGDTLYGGTADFPRQALHCQSLRFVHPFTEEEIEVTAPLPQDMQQFLEQQNIKID